MRLYLRTKHRERIHFDKRLRVLGIIIGCGFVILFLQLVYLQILAGGKFRNLSDRNSIRLLRLKAPRGLVLDRKGVLLLDNRPSFTVSVVPADSPDPETVLKKLHEFVEFDEPEVMAKIKSARSAPFSQIPVAHDISLDQAAAIEEYCLELPGAIITAEPCRRFPLKEQAAHVLGYLGEIGPDQLERLSDQDYLPGDYIGKSGLEMVAERWLHGESGGMQVQVYADGRPQIELDETGNPSVRIDTAGRELITLGKKLPKAGSALHLTIDGEIQKAAEAMMGEYNGAIIVMGANTGAIRALVSRPSFDPNMFVSSGMNDERKEVLTSSLHPLLNRALQSYAPGSTFKIVTAYAALAEGVITPDTRVCCSGSFYFGRTFRCWKDEGHGCLNVSQAIAYSCDVFFYTVGLELGIKRLARYAELFGLGQPTGIELPGETRGLVPSPEWKARTFKRPADKMWYEGETVNAAIGQGYTLVTPLQMARVVSAVMNGGHLITPYLIERVRNFEGEEGILERAAERKQVLHNANALELVREGLKQVVESRSPFFGTAWRAKNEIVSILGKTGTAQVAYFKERAETAEDLERIPYELRDHAWFVGGIEAKGEPLTIVVFCEHSGHGSESAVPIARDLAIKIAEMEGGPIYAVQEGEKKQT